MIRTAAPSAIAIALLVTHAAAQSGGCCFFNGSCAVHTQLDCTSQGGTYAGHGTTCADCGPTGACCIVSWQGYGCHITYQMHCAGTFHPGGDCSRCCYANCDESTAPPVLNVADFSCFLQRYAAGDPYANCDPGAPPPLNVADFVCFLFRYAQGCP
jgi:hypothetical protein